MNPPDDAAAGKPFLEHLEDLRVTLVRCAIALALAMAVALPFVPAILDLLKAPLVDLVDDPDRFLRSLQVAGAFTSALRLTFWFGLLISAPFLVFFVGQFVFPGLRQPEKEVIVKAGGFAILLFVLGVALGYFISLPVALGVMFRLHGWLGVQAEWTLSSYVAFTTQLLIGFGLVFQMPVVIIILGRLGLVRSRQLREKRRHVIVLLLVVAMLLTPPDIFTQLIMAVPLVGLYEVCIWVLKGTEAKK